MARRKSKTKSTFLSKPPASGQDLEELLETVYRLLDQRQPDQALEILKGLPSQYRRFPEYLYARGLALQMSGDFLSALDDLEEVIRKAPENPQGYFSLALAYAGLQYWGHALHYAERYLKRQVTGAEGVENVHQFILYAHNEITERASRSRIPLESFKQALFPHEDAQRFLALGEYRRAIKEAQRALRFANWAAPRNNRAMALFFLGNVEEAIKEEETVLQTIDAQNVHALGNLILFYLSLWQREKADHYASRLRDMVDAPTFEGIDLDKVIEGLGIWEDDEALWKLGSRLVKLPSGSIFLEGISWFILGSAAANAGHLVEAERLMKLAIAEGLPYQNLVEECLLAIKDAKRSHKSAIAPTLTGRFPYNHFTKFWPLHLATELLEKISKIKDSKLVDRYIEKYVQRYPFVTLACRQILWGEKEEKLREIGMDILVSSRNPEAIQEIWRFATSQAGSDAQRMQALAVLHREGRLEHGGRIRFWSEQDGEWREIESYMSEIEEVYEPPCNPRAAKFVDQGSPLLKKEREGGEINLEPAIQYFKQALEIDPDCVLALHNLGILYLRQGKAEEGEALVRRSVEVDPKYLFGYSTLAQLELGRNNLQAGKEYLQRIITAPAIPSILVGRMLALQVEVAMAEGDLETARSTLSKLKEIQPDYTGLPDLEKRVNEFDLDQNFYNSWLENVHRYRERLLRNPIFEDEGLASCLNRISRESLVGALHAWRVASAGRKAEVITRLVKVMLDQEELAQFIEEYLCEDERDALHWMLEGDGIRSWEEFTGRFEDDYNESPYWQYHEPETIPGRLRMCGLLAVGTLDGKRVAVIPYELRPLLRQILTG